MEYNMIFAENFKEARKKSGLTQQQVADRLGLDRSAVAHYEKGDSLPSLSIFLKICELFNLKMDELINI